MTRPTKTLGPTYAEGGRPALDHDVSSMLYDVLRDLNGRGVPYEAAVAAVRRVARGGEWK